MPHRIHDARRWRARAEEARMVADQLTNPESQRIMLGIALGYLQLARQAEVREADRRKCSD